MAISSCRRLSNSNLPPGYSLVQALGSQRCIPPTSRRSSCSSTPPRGPFGGVLHVLSNDADEGSFDVNLSGAVTAPEIRVFAGSTELVTAMRLISAPRRWERRSLQTFTIQNAGDGNLFVSGVSSSSLPAGFSLVTGFGDTTLMPGASVIVTVQLDAAAAGARRHAPRPQ